MVSQIWHILGETIPTENVKRNTNEVSIAHFSPKLATFEEKREKIDFATTLYIFSYIELYDALNVRLFSEKVPKPHTSDFGKVAF